jgi:phenylacetic acid degradation operon negative regulatory protein
MAIPDAAGSTSGPVDLPRAQSGPQPQHLLVTLLGDYWYERTEHLPSAALVALAAEFGVSPVGARAALSRLARRGLLASSKVGRRTYYGLTERAARVLIEGGQRIMAFGARTQPWDGSWTLVAFSVPEARRDVRHALRTRLRWLGFAPLYDGVWVSPRATTAEAARLLRELGVTSATVLDARVAADGPASGDPLLAWDLVELRGAYDRFVADYAPLLERVNRGSVGAAEALVARTTVVDIWRNFPNLDPELPEQLLPRGWPREQARRIFAMVYDLLGPLAEFRFRQVLSRFAPELAPLAQHHTTVSLLEQQVAVASNAP